MRISRFLWGLIAALLLLQSFAFSLAIPYTEIERARDVAYDLPTGDRARLAPDEQPLGSESIDVACDDGYSLIAVKMALSGKTASTDEWQETKQWVLDLASAVLADTEGEDSQHIADALWGAISDRRAHFHFEDGAALPLWADKSLLFTRIEVTSPYTPDLGIGARGKSVALLQNKLYAAGFYTGVSDGEYGEMTSAAVKEIQTFMRERENQAILALASRYADADDEAIHLSADMRDLGASPVAEPKTEVTGIADDRLQIYLQSDLFTAYERPLAYGDSGSDVIRLQRRLSALGYATDAPDGMYGANTQRGVLLYQHYANLPETGTADEETLSSIFSEDAHLPDNPMLASGSSGEPVKELQRRLKYLGFMKGGIDGSYGATTTEGVKNLQTYLRQREMDALLAQSAAPNADADSDDIAPAPPANASATENDVDMSKVKTAVNGIADPLLLDTFYADSFPAVPNLLKEGDGGQEVVRLQRRLADLSYLYSAPDGDYGSVTANAVQAFQRRNSLSADGVAGHDTLSVLYSSEAIKAQKPYLLKVDTSKQRVYAYSPDNSGEYTVLVKTMKCSTGVNATPTPKGTFQSTTGPGARWHYFKKFQCWAQYAYYIKGDIMFHSVLYPTKNGKVTQSSVRNLGRKASHGCVRLSVEDAKWLWNNCPRNTTVIVY